MSVKDVKTPKCTLCGGPHWLGNKFTNEFFCPEVLKFPPCSLCDKHGHKEFKCPSYRITLSKTAQKPSLKNKTLPTTEQTNPFDILSQEDEEDTPAAFAAPATKAKIICSFCHKEGHFRKNRITGKICDVLSAYMCLKCNTKGHTEKFCPVLNEDEKKSVEKEEFVPSDEDFPKLVEKPQSPIELSIKKSTKSTKICGNIGGKKVNWADVESDDEDGEDEDEEDEEFLNMPHLYLIGEEEFADMPRLV